MKEEKFYSNLCRRFPITSRRGNIYIYIMYVYYCNTMLMKAINNRGKNEMILDFTELTTEILKLGINPELSLM